MVIQEIPTEDCLHALARAKLGRLACAYENQPYVVPLYFVYHDPYLYGFTTPGQKVEWLRANPRVCVELDEVEGSEQWTSIIIFGQYEELPDTPEGEQERRHAHRLLQQHAEWWQPGCASRRHRDPAGPVTPVFYRVRIDHISGRRAMGEPVRSQTTSPARDHQGWLRRVLHALSKPFAGE
jgi:nitroimidazol reductase NimA-like FMN-containing flavoprotein (pyridoxamine 5'-phosphate oxidase superfamily)